MTDFSIDSRIRRRRWFGGICLLAAVGMVVADELGLKGRLGPAAFLGYWLVCFLFTLLAIRAALAEMRSVRRRIRDEHKGLFEETLREISREREVRHPKDDNKGPADAGGHP